MFNKGALFSLGSILGDPLKIDASTSSLSRPSTARICVDIDIQKPRPPRIWLEDGDRGFWQSVDYEDVPPLCSVCSKIGHLGEKCNQRESAKISSAKLQWVPKLTEISKDAAAVLSDNTPEAAVSTVPDAAAVKETLLVNPSTSIINLISPPTINSAAAAVLSAQFPAAAISTVQNAAADPCAAVILASSMDQPAAILSQAALSVAADLHSAPDVAAAATDVLCVPEAAAAAVLSVPDAAAAAVVSPAAAPDSAAARLGATAAIPAAVTSSAVPAVPWAVSAASEAANCPLDEVSTRLDNVLYTDSVPMECGVLNEDIPKQSEKSYAAVLLGAMKVASPHPVSSKPRFYAIKLAEFPSLPLPNFRILNLSCPFFPQFVDEPSSPRPADAFQVHSDGDAVPRMPTPRIKLSASLRSFHRELNAKLKKGRVPYAYPVIRRKWTKLAPISLPCPASTQPRDSNKASASKDIPLNASDHYGQPHVDHFDDEVSDDDDSVEYESVWRSSSSDDEAAIEFDTQLALQESLMPMDYNDFSLSPPQHTRRKYTKRFRDLPPPLRTRSSRERSL